MCSKIKNTRQSLQEFQKISGAIKNFTTHLFKKKLKVECSVTRVWSQNFNLNLISTHL